MLPFFIFGLTGYDEECRYRVFSGKKHTYYRVTYDYHCSLNDEISGIYDRFYASLNPFDPESIVSKVNKNEDVVLDAVFIEAFDRSKELAVKTKGLYDPTCAPLVNLWGFGFEKPGNASPDVIESIKEYVGHDKIHIESGKVIKADPRVRLNFSGIGDGFACEIIARYLDERGVENYMVDIGGEMVVKGKNRTGTDWTVGILKPPLNLGTGNSSEFETIIRLSGKIALATSGNYNNFRIRNERKYGHGINPLSGYPTDNRILSATIIASDCVTADAYATAVISSEREMIDGLLQSDRSLNYYIICSDGAKDFGTVQSGRMKDFLE